MEAESRAIDELMELGVDGIILMCVQGENYSTRIVKLALDKFPVILVDRALKGLPIPCIGTDNYRAAQDLVTSSVEERFNGYRDTMLEHKILTNEDLWMIDLDSLVENIEETREKEKKVMEAIENYVENHPQVTAFFTVDLQVYWCIEYCRKRISGKRLSFLMVWKRDMSFTRIARTLCRGSTLWGQWR